MARVARAFVRLGWALALAACTTTNAAAPEPDAEAVCPASVGEAVGVACTVEGLVCSPQYACGIATATATCTCTSGVFACVDTTGKTLDVDAAPACPPVTNSETCPSTEAIASGKACQETGLMCPYASTCSENTTEYDVCECFNGALADGAVGLRFECSSACASDAATIVFDTLDATGPDAGSPPPDAGAPTPDATTAHDASAPEASSGDASSPDARPD